MPDEKEIKSALESMMFVWGEPLDVKLAAEVFGIDWKEVYKYFKELQKEYETAMRGIIIREIDKTFQFCTCQQNNEYIERLCTPVKKQRLSQSAMEALAIVAYKQPVTKREIESIRGIRSDRIIESLSQKKLIEEVGRSTSIGRPILYGTTQNFLKYFGFESLKELPKIDDIKDALQINKDVEDIGSQQITININNT